MKLSQAPYLTHQQGTRNSAANPANSQKQGNLAINNRFKGILLMDFEESKDSNSKILRVFEHSWK